MTSGAHAACGKRKRDMISMFVAFCRPVTEILVVGIFCRYGHRKMWVIDSFRQGIQHNIINMANR